jgi:hypothetical protein
MASEDVEEWRTIPDFADYEVSTHGNVRSKTRVIVREGFTDMTLQSQTMKQWVMPATNYLKVKLQREKNQNARSVHRLVALTFIPNPENKPLVDHIDRNRQNNHLSNLRWVTHIENAQNSSLVSNTGQRNITHNVRKNRYELSYQREGITTRKTFKTLEEALVARLSTLGF